MEENVIRPPLHTHDWLSETNYTTIGKGQFYSLELPTNYGCGIISIWTPDDRVNAFLLRLYKSKGLDSKMVI